MVKGSVDGDDRTDVDKTSKLDQNVGKPFDPQEALDPQHAKDLIREILKTGNVVFTKHCREELKKDDRSTVDCGNALRGGAVQQPEWENGKWRYRVETGRVTVIVQIQSPRELIVITAWRTA